MHKANESATHTRLASQHVHLLEHGSDERGLVRHGHIRHCVHEASERIDETQLVVTKSVEEELSLGASEGVTLSDEMLTETGAVDASGRQIDDGRRRVGCEQEVGRQDRVELVL